jgi:SAM-dependent methyltransferase
MALRGVRGYQQGADGGVSGGMTSSGVVAYKQAEKKGKGRGHPVLFGMPEAEYFGVFPDGGGYPLRFLKRAFEIMGVTDPHQVLHVCSGSMKVGIRVDIRPEMNPTIVADARNLPFADNTFDWVMADPPYSEEYAANLYGTGDVYPNPHQLADECLRVLKPGGRMGFMHHIVPKFHKPGRLLKVYTITQGVGYNVRAWSVFTKEVE